MARIPNEEIERLKKEIPIERLVTGFAVELKRQGKDLFGRCPFHDDKTPSFSVSPETNLWHCLGACNGLFGTATQTQCFERNHQPPSELLVCGVASL